MNGDKFNCFFKAIKKGKGYIGSILFFFFRWENHECVEVQKIMRVGKIKEGGEKNDGEKPLSGWERM